MEKATASVKKRCPHCDAKMVEYRHVFNKGLAHGLYELFSAGGGPVNLRSLRITRTQWTNFQKLRYWGLASRTKVDGEWTLTAKGFAFITQGIGIPKWAWTYRGNTVRFEGDTCFFLSVHEPKYQKKADYADSAVAHGGQA
jgi:hypothetical protein